MTILFFGILYYKCEIRLSAFDEFINTDVWYGLEVLINQYWC